MTGSSVMEEARKYAIRNAHDYGSARLSPVLNKVLALFPDEKKNIKELAKGISKIIGEVNGMKAGEIEREYGNYREEFEREQESKRETGLPKFVVQGAEEGKVETRFPPEPGGYIHIGNMKQCILSDEIARVYKGRIHLYFDDTNPERCSQAYVDAIRSDTEWMGVRFDREYYASDFLKEVYDYGRTLIKRGNAYACFCTQERVKQNRLEGTGCAHREEGAEHSLSVFEDMLSGRYNDGEVTIRFMGDMSSTNETFRDPMLFRIKREKHYRQGRKYMVWPTYHMNTPVIDSLNGVTDVVRGKEYEMWDGLHKRILSLLGMRRPRVHYEARLRIIGTTTAKREIRELIKDGRVTGWDDPRLTTMIALRRRGIQPKAIRNFVLKSGMSKTDGMFSMDALLADNKREIEPIAKHLFFVHDPVRIRLDRKADSSMPIHPGSSDVRSYSSIGEVYASREDIDGIEDNGAVRLKDFMDVTVRRSQNGIIAERAKDAVHGKVIQWVPAENSLDCTVMVPGELMDEEGNILENSMRTFKGYAEGYAARLNLHDIVQFERFGYCVLDEKKGEEMRFIFISR